MNDSEFMYDFINSIIEKCGPRMPCSPQEAQSAELIKSELEKYCDETSIEKFSCQPRAFLGYIRIIIFLNLISFCLFFIIPLSNIIYWKYILTFSALFINVIAFLVIWNEFFNYREFIDPLFKRKESQNVIGKIMPPEETKKILIFSGHHDSALQFNLLKKFKMGYIIFIFMGLIVMFIWLASSFIILILVLVDLFVYEIILIYVIILFILGIPAFSSLFFFVSSGEKANKVPGAVDNLSAVAILLGIGKFLKENKNIIPKNTEIRLISFGCEEAGLRGAYRYVERHHEELKRLDAECVNMDGIQTPYNIAVIDFEPSTRTQHSDVVVQKLIDASQKANVTIQTSNLGGSGIFGQITGGTDATAFSKSKIKAANISAMDLKKSLSYYHQPTDTLDKIEKGALEEVLKICLSYIKIE